MFVMYFFHFFLSPWTFQMCPTQGAQGAFQVSQWLSTKSGYRYGGGKFALQSSSVLQVEVCNCNLDVLTVLGQATVWEPRQGQHQQGTNFQQFPQQSANFQQFPQLLLCTECGESLQSRTLIDPAVRSANCNAWTALELIYQRQLASTSNCIIPRNFQGLGQQQPHGNYNMQQGTH